MANWLDLARENRKTASWLVETGRPEAFRSGISRAYYAVYAKLSHELVLAGKAQWFTNGPPHRGLPKLIKNELVHLSISQREALVRQFAALYRLRIFADYRPDDEAEAVDAREAVALMKKAFDAF